METEVFCLGQEYIVEWKSVTIFLSVVPPNHVLVIPSLGMRESSPFSTYIIHSIFLMLPEKKKKKISVEKMGLKIIFVIDFV